MRSTTRFPALKLNEETVNVTVADAEPQLLVTVYDIMVVPTNTPLTTPVPVPTVAIAVFALVHTPSLVALANVVVPLTNVAGVPVMEATDGKELMVTVVTAKQPVDNA